MECIGTGNVKLDVDDAARDLADRLSKNAPLGMERAMEALNGALDMPIDEGLAYETALGNELLDTHDYEEGFNAQIEGREPEFEGR
jgi:enoyl-CoA hydratase